MAATIRLAAAADAAQLVAIYGPFCTESTVSFEVAAPTAAAMAERIRAIGAQLPWLVLEDAGVVAGYVYASAHRERAAYQWSVDVTAYIAAAFRRRGVGRALYTTLLDVLARQGYFKAYAGITLPNPASVGLHTALGFEPVGVYRGVGYKLGAWHDVAWYQRALRLEEPEPQPARPVGALVGTAGWADAIAAGLALYTAADA